MPPADMPPIDAQRAALLDVLKALAAFGRQRAERRAKELLRVDDKASKDAGGDCE